MQLPAGCWIVTLPVVSTPDVGSVVEYAGTTPFNDAEGLKCTEHYRAINFHSPIAQRYLAAFYCKAFVIVILHRLHTSSFMVLVQILWKRQIFTRKSLPVPEHMCPLFK